MHTMLVLTYNKYLRGTLKNQEPTGCHQLSDPIRRPIMIISQDLQKKLTSTRPERTAQVIENNGQQRNVHIFDF